MNLKILSVGAAVALGITAAALCGAQAADHPHYLHALSDLRMARALLEHPVEGNVMHQQSAAVEEINKAMGEIRRAAIDDGKDPNFRPQVDESLDLHGRLGKALDLVKEAHEDLGFKEDNLVSLGWREAAIHHVDEAQNAIDRAIHDKRMDER